MSEDPELDSFLSSLSQQLIALRRDADPSRIDPQRVVSVLDTLGATDLARDTEDLPNSMQWLSSVVRVCAGFSPSIAFALAGRYVAQRVEHTSDSSAVTAAVAVGVGASGWRATVPALVAPAAVVLLERSAVAGRVVSWDTLRQEAPMDRTGLKDADLRTVTLLETDGAARALTRDQACVALFDHDLLSASVALGILERAVATSEEYATTRRQFGEPIARFAGLAAIVVDMRLRASTVGSLLADSLERGQGSHELAAVAGRACVESCLDAIQVHGGYGYIDEYPTASLLRDAISLRARGGGRRSAIAAVAAAHLHSV